MCSCEGKQFQLLLENSSRQCQMPNSCIFAKKPHASCFSSGGAHCGDFRHHGMAWEETFEDSGAESFLQLLGAWRCAGLSIPHHPAEPLHVGPRAATGTGSVGPSTHSAAATEPVCLISATAWSSCKLLHQISQDAFQKHFLRYSSASRLDYLRNISLVGRKVHTFRQLSAIRICQGYLLCK